jgi:hypothetical protein
MEWGFLNQLRFDSRCWLEWRPAFDGPSYSLDLRERVVAAAAAGESRRKVVASFKVGVARADTRA